MSTDRHDSDALRALVLAAWAVLEGDDPCPDCGQEPEEGEGLCEEGCRRRALVVALRPFGSLAWRAHHVP